MSPGQKTGKRGRVKEVQCSRIEYAGAPSGHHWDHLDPVRVFAGAEAELATGPSHGGESMGHTPGSSGNGVSRGVMGSWGSAYLRIGLLELSRVMCTRSRSDLRTRRYRFIASLSEQIAMATLATLASRVVEGLSARRLRLKGRDLKESTLPRETVLSPVQNRGD